MRKKFQRHSILAAMSGGVSLTLNANNPFMPAPNGGVPMGGMGQPQTQVPPVAPVPTAPQPAPQVTQPQSGIVPGMPAQTAPVNPADGNNGLQNTAPATEGGSPLDPYKDLYNNKNSGKEKGNGDPQQDILDATLEDYQSTAGKLNFTQNLDSELVGKALGGDQEAFLNVINAATQNAYAQAAYAGSQVTRTALDGRINTLKDGIPEQIRTASANAGLLEGNSQLQHPAVQPLVTALQAQFAKQYPEATPADLQKHTITYLQNIGMSVNPDTSQQQAQSDSPAEESWGDFFTTQS